jgi:hypothetical protein
MRSEELKGVGTLVIVLSDISAIANWAAIHYLKLLPQLYNQRVGSAGSRGL